MDPVVHRRRGTRWSSASASWEDSRRIWKHRCAILSMLRSRWRIEMRETLRSFSTVSTNRRIWDRDPRMFRSSSRRKRTWSYSTRRPTQRLRRWGRESGEGWARQRGQGSGGFTTWQATQLGARWLVCWGTPTQTTEWSEEWSTSDVRHATGSSQRRDPRWFAIRTPTASMITSVWTWSPSRIRRTRATRSFTSYVLEHATTLERFWALHQVCPAPRSVWRWFYEVGFRGLVSAGAQLHPRGPRYPQPWCIHDWAWA